MREITIAKTVNAPGSAVWSVLADYGAIAWWNRNVKSSHTTKGVQTGLGAQRYCKMAPAGSILESITQWEPESIMVLEIDKAKLVPIKAGSIRYQVSPGADPETTDVEVLYRFTAKGGPFAQLIESVVAKQLATAFEDVLTDLETASVSVESDPDEE